ncbi:MAG TPA: M23 family metallopeptidase [Ottowia sp.]|uniref:M23 family metallopeptidase n=1 Tax=Ottowia sp. TaxID=1898956 RepID=UPI002CB464F1|nr:M23 family metallopeptidase [Ottowia sp.]HMN20071.1 M23 family metallopeptidase [Ottowia sp.]
MKQELISSGLAVADFIHRHPKRITAVLAAFLLSGAGGAFAVASLAPTAPTQPLRLLTESVLPQALDAQLQQLDAHAFTLYRSDRTHASDSPEGLLKRLGVADPEAAAFLRRNQTAWDALFGRTSTGRMVTVEADDRQGLQRLRTQWADGDSNSRFKRLVVEKNGADFSARVETAPLVATQRLASGVIRTSLFAATDESNVPDSVARQFVDIFESSVDFRRGMHRGDRFSIVYESLEADGEPLRTGRILSAELVNRGKTHEALWYQESASSKGSYYSFDGQSLRKAYLIAPLAFTRMTSAFGMRSHPVYGGRRGHAGIDYGAPKGTPVRTVGDGVVEFAGVQNGYGNVIYIKHGNKQDTTVYGHLSRIDVKTGQAVEQGDKIGEVGATGLATGPHLHFEFRINGEPQNPAAVLAEQRERAPIAVHGRADFAQLATAMRLQLEAAAQSVADASTFE